MANNAWGLLGIGKGRNLKKIEERLQRGLGEAETQSGDWWKGGEKETKGRGPSPATKRKKGTLKYKSRP